MINNKPRFCEKCHKAYKQREYIVPGSPADKLCEFCFDELVRRKICAQKERAGVIFWDNENAWKMDLYK